MGIVAAISDLLFPPRCIFCRRLLRRGASGACESCLSSLTGDVRVRMGSWFSLCVVPMDYAGPVRDAILRFKFEDQPGYATAFGRILAESIREHLAGEYDLITWVPVSARRLRKRGYDQAMLLAMAAALELQDVAVETLEKQADNPAQSAMQSAEARRSNVLGAYRVPDPELVAGKRVLLIDDIITTGATLEEASHTLRQAGAAKVLAAALAQPLEEDN